jgi:Arc/MetJ family transcription regulator
MSRTTLNLDERALAAAQRLAPGRSKTEVINEALREYSRHRAYAQLLELEGQVVCEADLDALRKRSGVGADTE